MLKLTGSFGVLLTDDKGLIDGCYRCKFFYKGNEFETVHQASSLVAEGRSISEMRMEADLKKLVELGVPITMSSLVDADAEVV